jgi:cytochrome c biogenesis protein CcdA/thiol-disulfide isomerase/thioredoxin
MAELAFALAAGLLTVASPCVLPMLPILLGASVGRQDRLRPLCIVTGFVASFAVLALAFGAGARVLGLSQGALRHVAIAALLGFGTLSAFPRLFERLARALAPVATLGGRVAQRGGDGRLGALALGAALGALWTPCAGPVLASILVLIASAEAERAAPMLFAYALGCGLPMLAIAHGGQAASARAKRVARHAVRLQRSFGVVVVATALAMLGGYDVRAAAALSPLLPEIERPVSRSAPGDPAPELVGIEAWLNSEPLRLADLRGRVVLVDFFTYGCINCVRTLPDLVRWHDRYAAEGLVVLGVHTPEFAFERELDSVRAALERFGITYPVAIDNRYETWTAWRNRYWPTVYLIGRDGNLLLTHSGEGGYDAIERALQEALASGSAAGSDGEPGPPESPRARQRASASSSVAFASGASHQAKSSASPHE